MLDIFIELGVLDAFPFQPFVQRIFVQLEVGLEEVPMFQRVLGAFHISFGRVADEGLGVVPEVFPEDIQEAVRPAVGDGLYVIMRAAYI